ncbi:MAG: pilus assembly protein TadG, partial [Hyphomicrobiales bacterium]|nr:pilus assembly protein TadG [Hyphomicrobiales bacterium]
MQRSPFTSAKDGAVIPTFAVGLVVVVAMIGLAVDWGRTTTVRARMQASLDSAVIAAAKNLMSGN